MKKIITIASQEVGQNGLNIKDDCSFKDPLYILATYLSRVGTHPIDVSHVGVGWGRRDKNSYYCSIKPAPIINSNNMRIIPTARQLKANENTTRMPFFSTLL
jgi:uncharacterized protein (UPF0305 family)